jgi:hypothetical protein
MQEQFKKLLEKQCLWHPGAKHSAIECSNLRRTFNAPPLDKNAKKKGEGNVRPRHTGLCTRHTFSRIRDETWPTHYICCNYS